METTIQKSKQNLRDEGYFTDNLWHVNDVTDLFKCDDELAQSILYKALTNPRIIEEIHYTIREISLQKGLQEKEDTK